MGWVQVDLQKEKKKKRVRSVVNLFLLRVKKFGSD